MIYTNKFINLLSLVLTIIIFIILKDFMKNPIKESENIINDYISNIDFNIKENIEKKDDILLEEWYIEIPSIKLIAPISEGTSMEILNSKVGHFEDTGITEGNIGLAAHNRGYENNYFKNLKNIKMDDEIFYYYKGLKKIYVVDKIEIIKNTDWSYLENYNDENRVTLITCVENKPDLRRCVQAREVKK